VEDLWGAGAVIAALADLGVSGQSAEARTAQAAFLSVAARLPAELADCASGRELIDAGFADDVAIAAELDASHSVPVIDGERFVNEG
jgi:2-phosphosulfolactate phosphatase